MEEDAYFNSEETTAVPSISSRPQLGGMIGVKRKRIRGTSLMSPSPRVAPTPPRSLVDYEEEDEAEMTDNSDNETVPEGPHAHEDEELSSDDEFWTDESREEQLRERRLIRGDLTDLLDHSPKQLFERIDALFWEIYRMNEYLDDVTGGEGWTIGDWDTRGAPPPNIILIN